MSVKSSTELMLYVVLTMPTLNKAYLLIFLFIVRDELCQTLEQIKISHLSNTQFAYLYMYTVCILLDISESK